MHSGKTDYGSVLIKKLLLLLSIINLYILDTSFQTPCMKIESDVCKRALICYTVNRRDKLRIDNGDVFLQAALNWQFRGRSKPRETRVQSIPSCSKRCSSRYWTVARLMRARGKISVLVSQNFFSSEPFISK